MTENFGLESCAREILFRIYNKKFKKENRSSKMKYFSLNIKPKKSGTIKRQPTYIFKLKQKIVEEKMKQKY